ncbi:MAG: glycoside hydrolase family 88 protein [Bacteroidales bacterium]|nr:glycoside hydrolase family 88 protein [Bacteroidales bacterium]
MKRCIYILLAMLSLAGCSRQEPMDVLADRVFSAAREQCLQMDGRLTDQTLPRTIGKNGEFVSSNINWWCSGFFPGTLWYVYEYTGDSSIKELAVANTLKLEPLQYRAKDHDLGFQMNCSYGNAYRITGEQRFLAPIYTSALALAGRFSPATGTIRSWDFVRAGRDWRYPVIIDNMMNLEHLLNAADLFRDNSLRDMAIAHANTTMCNHFREDFSCWHLVDYDPETGAVRSRETVQGYADASSWARGQAWALYGYTMMFRFTGYECYLRQAENIADMIVDRLPADGIPYWDFDAPDIPDAPKDASAAAVMASAFADLGTLTTSDCNSRKYSGMAERQLRTLASDIYLAKPGENCNFILKHSVGNLPGDSEVDVPLSYADYYFLEALIKYITHNNN